MEQDALKEGVREGHVTSPHNRLHHCVLVDRTDFFQRNHVAVLVRTPMDIAGVEEVHVVVRASPAVTTVKHNIRALVFQGHETSVSLIRLRDALNVLQRRFVQAEIVVVAQDQVRLVRTARALAIRSFTGLCCQRFASALIM